MVVGYWLIAVLLSSTMASFVKHMTVCQGSKREPSLTSTTPSSASPPVSIACPHRRAVIASSALLVFGGATPGAFAENWGARSYIKEHYFQPELSSEDAVARIQQTADGLREMRPMLDRLAWRYVLRYVRLKAAYLSSDLKNALIILPENRRAAYVKTANELIDSMSELDRYVRTPKVYESYVYYEKSLISLDEIVAMLVPV